MDKPFVPDDSFMRDFLDMPKATVTSTMHDPTGAQVQAYCKKHIGLIVMDGRLLIGVRDDFTQEFLIIRSVPGSLTAEHIKDKRPIRWWQLWRMWKRLPENGREKL